MPNSCVFSGPNGNLKFWCFGGTRDNFDAGFFTSFAPTSVLEITDPWVGQRTGPHSFISPQRQPWKQTAAGVHGAFRVSTKVEDLTIVGCETEPFFSTLGATADEDNLLPVLQRLTVYIGCGDLAVSALIQCAKARKEHSRQLGKVTMFSRRIQELIWPMRWNLSGTPWGNSSTVSARLLGYYRMYEAGENTALHSDGNRRLLK